MIEKFKENLKRTRKLLGTKLYSRNLIKGKKIPGLSPFVRYSGLFLKSSSSSYRAGSTDIPDPPATPPYRSSPSVGLQDNILYPHIAAECTFELVTLLLRGHVWGSIRVHLL